GLKQRTALMAAAAFNQPEVVRLLLKRDADPKARDEDGETALSVAEDKGNKEIISLLQAAATPS
ncbi:MAG TPA: ankyrin repeat domain-containing protein, partial [Chromatiales bacterium]|nr:ankyrin repeat domain-containing protein [Chromatiales bacterium]HEX23139.1 ankyrin repeat domain-containing protein [Chromatiales bacterium]